MMTWMQLGFQDANSPIMEEFIFFHDYTMVVVIFIISYVFISMIGMNFSTWVDLRTLESQSLETIWTIIPGLFLLHLAIPSISLLYMMEEDSEHAISLKTVGHQWYWSYEYGGESSGLAFDSYMSESGMRLLDVDNRVVLPFLTEVRVLITAADVLHSWTVPSLGVKGDACPGRVNQVQFVSFRPGVVFGQCSEICGANHSFMPIVMELVSMEDFLKWVELY